MLRVDGEFNFSRLINRGAAAAKGDVLAFLNNDIDASEPGWLREMVSHAVRAGVGAVGARLWYPNGTLQHGGVVIATGVVIANTRTAPSAPRRGQPARATDATTHASSAQATIESATCTTITVS